MKRCTKAQGFKCEKIMQTRRTAGTKILVCSVAESIL